jgi:methylase of polypeptide subunit release factors
VSIDLGGRLLTDFLVQRSVLRPEVVSSLYLARYLWANRGRFRGASIIDMGCGTGIQGVVMLMAGASAMQFCDISESAVANASRNLSGRDFPGSAVVARGDLFDPVSTSADIIVFNHPFFPLKAPNDDPIALSIMDDGTLLTRFLEQAPNFTGHIIMPFAHAAGQANDPGLRAPRMGYRVATKMELTSSLPLNPGRITIYELDCPGTLVPSCENTRETHF